MSAVAAIPIIDDERRQVLEWRAQNLSWATIATKLGKSYVHIYHKYKVNADNPKPPLKGVKTRALQRSREAIIKILCKKELNEGIVVKGMTTHQITALRPMAIRKGFNLGYRTVSNGFFVFKTTIKHLSPKKLELAEQIHTRIVMGDTYDAIAADLQVTRQRIEQRYKEYMTCVDGVAPNRRSALVDNILLPYIKELNTVPVCFLCGTASTKEGSRKAFTAGICTLCREAIRARMLVAARLRSYLKLGDQKDEHRYLLAQALMTIRQYDIKPEHLKNI